MNKRKRRPDTSPEEIVAAWVAAHGEAVTVNEAARLLSVHPQTIYRKIKDGVLGYTPNKRVLVRSLCLYAYGRTA